MTPARRAFLWAALAVSIAMCAAPAFIAPASWGVYPGCPLGLRLCYQFAHASFIHAALNAWCLLSLLFLYRVSALRLLAAYAISAAVPNCCLSSLPTVGLSGVCFALAGIATPGVKRKKAVALWAAASIALGFLFPAVNAPLHLFCFLAGLGAGLLTTPFPWTPSKKS